VRHDSASTSRQAHWWQRPHSCTKTSCSRSRLLQYSPEPHSATRASGFRSSILRDFAAHLFAEAVLPGVERKAEQTGWNQPQASPRDTHDASLDATWQRIRNSGSHLHRTRWPQGTGAVMRMRPRSSERTATMGSSPHAQFGNRPPGMRGVRPACRCQRDSAGTCTEQGNPRLLLELRSALSCSTLACTECVGASANATGFGLCGGGGQRIGADSTSRIIRLRPGLAAACNGGSDSL